jgi:hypothetical protein
MRFAVFQLGLHLVVTISDTVAVTRQRQLGTFEVAPAADPFACS